MINTQRPRAARVIATGTTGQLAALLNTTVIAGLGSCRLSEIRALIKDELYRRHTARAEAMATGQILDELEPLPDFGPEATRIHVHALMNALHRYATARTTEQLAALLNTTAAAAPGSGGERASRALGVFADELYRRHADRAEAMTTGQILDELEPIVDLQLTGPEATRIQIHALMNELYGRHGKTRTAEDQWHEESQHDEAVYLCGPAGHTVRALRALDTP